jgi:hypothetical protein
MLGTLLLFLGKETFLAKSSQFQLRRMDLATFDAIRRTETGAWSTAVASETLGQSSTSCHDSYEF